jgi:hypothetical protein
MYFIEVQPAHGRRGDQHASHPVVFIVLQRWVVKAVVMSGLKAEEQVMPTEALLSEPIAAPAAPVARVQPVTDTYFGETVCDRYRWMENDKDPDWLPFLKGQQATRAPCSMRCPGREALLTRSRSSRARWSQPQESSARAAAYSSSNALGANNFKLFVREAGKTVCSSIDRARYRREPCFARLVESFTRGTRLVYGSSRDGSENRRCKIMQVDNGAVLAEKNRRHAGRPPAYGSRTAPASSTTSLRRGRHAERYLDSRARFHRVGSDPATDPIIVRAATMLRSCSTRSRRRTSSPRHAPPSRPFFSRTRAVSSG